MSRKRGTGTTTVALLVSDLDGTLLRPDGSVAAAVKEAVQAVQAAGLPMAVCTARPTRTLEPIYRDLGLTGPAAAYNGALVYQPTTGQVLLEHAMERETALQVLDILAQAAPGADAGMELDGAWWVNQMNERLEHAIATGRIPSQPAVGALHDVVHSTQRSIRKIYMIGPHSVRHQVIRRLQSTCGDDVAVTSSGEDFLEVSAALANKGTALRFLAERQGVPVKAAAYLGDAENDVPALRLAGLAVAMGQAPDAVKTHAHRVAPPNSMDGWAAAVRQWVLA